MQYKTISPDTNSPSGFSDSDLITFIVPVDPGMEVVAGSIYISGSLTVSKTGGVLVVGDGVEYDSLAGIHSFFDNIVTYVNRGQGDEIRENAISYWNYAHTLFEAKAHWLTHALQSSAGIELRCGQDTYTTQVLLGQRTDDNSANTGINSFSFLPLICANQTSANISGDSVNSITIAMTCRAALQALYAPAPVAGLAYNLSDMRLHYGVVQSAPGAKPVPNEYKKVLVTKTTIQSSNVTLQYAPPGMVLATSCVFNKIGTAKPWQTSQIPNVTRVEFSVNGADYTMKFPLNTEEEIILNYIKSLNYPMRESNAIYGNLLGYGYGIGINYLTPIDFRKNRLGINIQSTIAPNDQYTTYIYYTCVDTI